MMLLRRIGICGKFERRMRMGGMILGIKCGKKGGRREDSVAAKRSKARMMLCLSGRFWRYKKEAPS
jgi:hypothetical protein